MENLVEFCKGENFATDNDVCLTNAVNVRCEDDRTSENRFKCVPEKTVDCIYKPDGEDDCKDNVKFIKCRPEEFVVKQSSITDLLTGDIEYEYKGSCVEAFTKCKAGEDPSDCAANEECKQINIEDQTKLGYCVEKPEVVICTRAHPCSGADCHIDCENNDVNKLCDPESYDQATGLFRGTCVESTTSTTCKRTTNAAGETQTDSCVAGETNCRPVEFLSSTEWLGFCVSEVSDCERPSGCTLEECHFDCQFNDINKKCRPLQYETLDGEILQDPFSVVNYLGGKYKGVCVECLADNQCVEPNALKCSKSSLSCVDGTSLAKYATVDYAAQEVFKRMDATQDAIGGVQTNGASVAKVYGDTR